MHRKKAIHGTSLHNGTCAVLELPKLRACIKTLQGTLCMCILWRKRTQKKEGKCRRRNPRCALCKGDHPAWSKNCSYHQKERLALIIKAKERVSIHIAREKAIEKMQQPTSQSQNRIFNQPQNRYSSQSATPQFSYSGMARRNITQK